MGVEENDDKPINMLEVQPEIPEEEPIEQVFSQEWTVEPSTESEDQERFEETAKFEEEIDASKVEPKPVAKASKKIKGYKKKTYRNCDHLDKHSIMVWRIQDLIILLVTQCG